MTEASMLQVSIVPDDQGLADLIGALEMVSTKYLPNTVRAIKVSTALLEYTWKAYAMGAAIPGTKIRLKSVRGEYAKSIHKSFQGLHGVVYSDSPYAASIEDGEEAKDLKKIIPFGPRARMGKNGPYSIVPFRHGAPGSLSAPMPSAVYGQILAKIRAGEIKKSTVQKKVPGFNAAGEVVLTNKYKWGSRMKLPQFPNLEGMVVFNVSAGNQARGEYLTFRVVSANAPKQSNAQKGWANSWVVPARQGMHLTRYVVANTKEVIGEAIRAGITMDLMP
ncbi:MAG: hypothetical protein C4K49_10590 [Candidatus Thorarchaeota archaeon]|nr:MAG: hypothetical protein C4K49_10590 [Candidatus Thorarchaeota archaeon]